MLWETKNLTINGSNQRKKTRLLDNLHSYPNNIIIKCVVLTLNKPTEVRYGAFVAELKKNVVLPVTQNCFNIVPSNTFADKHVTVILHCCALDWLTIKSFSEEITEYIDSTAPEAQVAIFTERLKNLLLFMIHLG